jgi:hypothetical protein
MKDMKKIYLLIIFCIFQLLLDISTNKCLKEIKDIKDRFKLIVILIIHHIISVFGHFGWIINNRQFLISYVLFVTGVFIHWMMDGGCFVTVLFNNICGYKHYEYFHDIFYFLNLKQLSPILMGLGLLIAVYKLA